MIDDAERFERLHRLDHIVAVVAGSAVALAHEMQLLVVREPAGVLRMAAIDHVAQRVDAPLRRAREPDAAHQSRDTPRWSARARADRRASPRDAWPRPDRRCRGRRRRSRGRARGRAAPACRDDRRNRRRASGAADDVRRHPLDDIRSPAARSASHSRTPRDPRRRDRNSASNPECAAHSRTERLAYQAASAAATVWTARANGRKTAQPLKRRIRRASQHA